MFARWWEGGEMPTLEERVAYLEGRFGDQAGVLDELRQGQSAIHTEQLAIRAEQTAIHAEQTAIRTEQTAIRAEQTAIRAEIRAESAAVRGDLTELRHEMNRRFETVDGKIDRHFTWLVGIQVAMLVAIVGALVGSYYR